VAIRRRRPWRITLLSAFAVCVTLVVSRIVRTRS
jgi:hypothetical protein